MTSDWQTIIERCLTAIKDSDNAYRWTVISLLLSIFTVAWTLQRKQLPQTPTLTSTRTATKPMTSQKSTPAPGDVVVSKILIHPIKSCRGISVHSANYTPEGLENDRIWCIIDAVEMQVLTAREVGKMVLITPLIESNGTLKVIFPEGSGCPAFSTPLKPTQDELKKWSILPEITLWTDHAPVDGYVCESVDGPKGSASQILSKYMERPVHLVYKGPHPRSVDPTTAFPDLKATAKYQDLYPLLVLSEESTGDVNNHVRKYVGVQGIEERWKTDKVVIERFRPNIVFRGGGPFVEDDWEEINIGSSHGPTIRLVSKCTRCLLPNVSPETGVRDNAVPFKVLMKFRTGIDPVKKMKPCLGCNGVPSGNGTVNVGDWVYVKKMV